jgi:hypothetical protein
MAEHLWTVLCTKASIDSTTNNLSLFEVIEELAISSFPENQTALIALSADLATLCIRSKLDTPEKAQGRTTVIGPSGRELGTGLFEIDLSTHPRCRSITRFNALPVEGPGEYYFVIAFSDNGTSWREVARVPLFVKIDPQVTKT